MDELVFTEVEKKRTPVPRGELEKISMKVHKEAWFKSVTAEWTPEQEEKWQSWLAIYKDKYPPEKIEYARTLWEEKGYGRSDPEEVAPVEETVEPVVEETPAPVQQELEEEPWETVGWQRWQDMSQEERARWEEEHGGMSPQYTKPTFREIKETVSSEKWASIILGFGDEIPGGLADEYFPEEFDEDQLERGIEVELEHTDDEQLALEIAMDHLVEEDDYYDQLDSLGL